MRLVLHAVLMTGLGIALGVQSAIAADAAPVVSVVRARSDRAGEPNAGAVGDRVVLTVRNLRALLVHPASDCQALTLVIDDLPLRGVQAEACDLAHETATFRISRPESADEAWHALLRGGTMRRAVEVSIAAPSRGIVRSTVADFQLETVQPRQLFVFATIAIAFWAFVIAVAAASQALRTHVRRRGPLAPHDASRWQLVWWSIVVVTSYAYLRMVTGEAEPLDGANASIIISAAVAMVVWIGGASRSPMGRSATTRGFLKDLASEFDELSVPALQFVAWNIVIGLLFLATVYQRMRVPQLSAPLLGLQALSATIYVLFKLPRPRET